MIALNDSGVAQGDLQRPAGAVPGPALILGFWKNTKTFPGHAKGDGASNYQAEVNFPPKPIACV